MNLQTKIKIIIYALFFLVILGLSIAIITQKEIIKGNKDKNKLLNVEIEKLNNEIDFEKKNMERVENFSNSSEEINQIKNKETLKSDIKTSIDAVIYDFYKHSLSNNE